MGVKKEEGKGKKIKREEGKGQNIKREEGKKREEEINCCQ